MAASKIYFDKRAPRADGRCPLKVSISHGGRTALISLELFLLPEEWDARKSCVVGHPNRTRLNLFIQRRKLDIDGALLDLGIKGALKGRTATQIKDEVVREVFPERIMGKEQPRVGTFVESYRKFMSMKTNARTREIYRYTLDRLYKFCPKLDTLFFEDITRKWLMEFDVFMATTSPNRNARNIHLRNIRAVFNDAIDDEVTSAYPFRRLKIKNEATVKRSLTVEELRTIFTMEVEEHQVKYRDLFVLIFLLMGINVIDLCQLKHDDLCGDRLSYRRAKTKRLYDIKVEPEAAALMERMKGKKHLLFILDRYDNYKNFAARLNRELRRLGPMERRGLGGKKFITPLFPKLTTYWARHSWATVAAGLDIPKETIAAALGHGGNTVTDIYINFDRRKVDEANRKVIDWVFYGKK